MYLRVTEEVSEGDPRYFDLPLEIEVKEEVLQGRIFVQRVDELEPFLPNQEQRYEFSVENANNVVLDVIISVQTLPSRLDCRIHHQWFNTARKYNPTGNRSFLDQ